MPIAWYGYSLLLKMGQMTEARAFEMDGALKLRFFALLLRVVCLASCEKHSVLATKKMTIVSGRINRI
jgi:hypothetical protein